MWKAVSLRSSKKSATEAFLFLGKLRALRWIWNGSVKIKKFCLLIWFSGSGQIHLVILLFFLRERVLAFKDFKVKSLFILCSKLLKILKKNLNSSYVDESRGNSTLIKITKLFKPCFFSLPLRLFLNKKLKLRYKKLSYQPS